MDLSLRGERLPTSNRAIPRFRRNMVVPASASSTSRDTVIPCRRSILLCNVPSTERWEKSLDLLAEIREACRQAIFDHNQLRLSDGPSPDAEIDTLAGGPQTSDYRSGVQSQKIRDTELDARNNGFEEEGHVAQMRQPLTKFWIHLVIS